MLAIFCDTPGQLTAKDLPKPRRGEGEVLVRRLKQEVPGQLGAICSALGDASVNIIILYSDHANQLILVTDDIDKARTVTAEWQ